MASLELTKPTGRTSGSVDVDDALFGVEPNIPVMHQVVTAQLAARRAGTQSTKTRAEVRGGGAKPWRQKGTGRSRQGSIRAPQWRGGGGGPRADTRPAPPGPRLPRPTPPRAPRGAIPNDRSPRHHRGAGREREVVRPHGGRRLHVHRPPRRLQAADPRRRAGDLRRQGGQGEHHEPAGQAQAQPPHLHLRPASRHQASDRHPRRGRLDRPVPGLRRGSAMALRKRKPTSPGRRFQTVADFSELTRDKPERSLVDRKPSTGGRNVHGRKTARHRGGGHKQRYRVIDFRRNKDGVPAKVAAIEYDPNRSCRIALLHYLDGEKRYILAPRDVEVGDLLQSGQGSEIRPGNALPLRYIPVGTTVHNVELKPGAGGKMARSAGSSVVLLAKEGAYATLRLPSTEMRRVSIDCRATVGEVGNPEHELVKVGKAGRNRWKGVRPQTRGVAMNPVDHPLGGGEGKSSGGRHPVSPWGQPEGRTRKRNKASNKYIVRRRT